MFDFVQIYRILRQLGGSTSRYWMSLYFHGKEGMLQANERAVWGRWRHS